MKLFIYNVRKIVILFSLGGIFHDYMNILIENNKRYYVETTINDPKKELNNLNRVGFTRIILDG